MNDSSGLVLVNNCWLMAYFSKFRWIETIKMKRATTLKDIAKVLKVTPATVSRALHDLPSS